MKVYLRRDKTQRGHGNFFYGDYGEIPIGLSYTTIDKNNVSTSKDTEHYHKEGYEFYFTIRGEGIIEVEGKEAVLDNKHLVMVEPGEKHYVKKVLKIPFSVLTVCTTKEKDDKVVLDNGGQKQF